MTIGGHEGQLENGYQALEISAVRRFDLDRNVPGLADDEEQEAHRDAGTRSIDWLVSLLCRVKRLR